MPEEDKNASPNEVCAVQMHTLYGQTLPSFVTNLVSAFLFSLLLWQLGFSQISLIAWLATLMAVLAVRVVLFSAYKAGRPGAGEAQSWVNRYTLTTAMLGLAWGSAGVLFYYGGNHLYHLIISVWVLCMSSFALAYIAHLRSFLVFLLCCTGPLVLGLVVMGGTFEVLLALGLTIYLLAAVILVRPVHYSVLKSIRLNIELLEDIKTRQDLEQEVLLQSEMMSQMTEGVYLVQMDGTIVFANPRFEQMFGYDPGEMIGKNASMVNYPGEKSPEEIALEILAILDRKGVWEGDILNIKKDGRPFWSHASVSTFEHSKYGKVLVASHVDISERKLNEQKLRRLSSAVEQTHEAIAITDRNATIQYINYAFTQLTGYSQGEAIGQNPRILKSGRQSKEFYASMWRSLNAGKPWQARVINKRKDDSTYPALLTVSPIKNEQGEIANFVGIQQDLSIVETLQERLQQAQKMEALGTLVGGIAHEFNNSLSGITGNLYLAKQQVEGMPSVLARLESIEQLSFESAELIKNLLQFARKGIVQKAALPFMPFFKESIKFHRASLSDDIKVDLKACDSPMVVEGDASVLRQVLVNVLNNARDALEATSEPTIRAELRLFQADDDFLARNSECSAETYALVSIRDNGEGIEEDNLERVFEPFHTTKTVGMGTGLGLSMSYGAVKAHGGTITIDSAPGVGTEVQIYLPCRLPEPSDPLEDPVSGLTPAAEESTKGGELILLVDDNESLLETAEEILESLGYRVLTAINGQRAVEIFTENSEEIDLVLVDVVMPVMGGVEAVRKMRDLVPGLKVLYASGYDRENMPEKLDLGVDYLISKPFKVDVLRLVLRLVLDS